MLFKQASERLHELTNIFNSKDIIIFGTGIGSKILTTVLNIKSLKPCYYVDNNPEKWNRNFFSEIIKNPSSLLEIKKNNSVILIASMYYDEISVQLKEMGFNENVDYFSIYKKHKNLSTKANNSKTDLPKLEKDVLINFFNDEVTDNIKDNYSQSLILDRLCKKNKIQLLHGIMEYNDSNALITLIHEILINEDYYFETNTDTPYILDCGTNFGLAIYYFKNLYPKANIMGFEPVPELRELALKNIKRNDYQDVKILPFALSDTDKISTFYLSKTSSMAASLTKRRKNSGDKVEKIKVICHKLSRYLQKPIHFLKLDIEGSESEVIASSEHLLSNVQYIFCEYHHGNGLNPNRLVTILNVLERTGFDVHISKSHNSYKLTKNRPMRFVTNAYSAIIWAKNKKWKN